MARDEGERVPAVIASHLDITYQVLGSKRRGTASGQGERSWLRRLMRRQRQVGGIRYVEAVKDVSFRADQGESIGIIGHNGSGKSTLLRALAGLLPPTSGRVWLNGEPALLGVNAILVPELSGERNVFIGAQALGLSKAQVEAKFQSIVDLADIGEAIERPMSTYSSGQGARLRFAISTAASPDILMIDEALATGDAAFKQRSLAKMGQLLENAGTVFLVSHSNKTIVDMCQRAIWMDHGRLVLDGPAEEVVAQYAAGQVPGSHRSPVTNKSSQRQRTAGRAVPIAKPEPMLPVIRTIVWGIPLARLGAKAGGTSTAEVPEGEWAELLQGLTNAGIVVLDATGEDLAAEVLEGPLHRSMVKIRLDGDPLGVAIDQILDEFHLNADQTLVVDSDAGELAAVKEACPQVLSVGPVEDEILGYLRALLHRVAGTGVPLTYAYRNQALLHEQVEATAGAPIDMEASKLRFSVLDRLGALHLAGELEHLVNTAEKLNFTKTRCPVGQMRHWVADLRRNSAFAVLAWNQAGALGVVGFVCMARPKGELQHFVFADRVRGTGLPGAVAAWLTAAHGYESDQFPAMEDPPWVSHVDAHTELGRRLIATSGFGPALEPSLRVMAGWDTGLVISAVGAHDVFAPNPTGMDSLMLAAKGTFEPGAGVVAYWAGREYLDQRWGEQEAGLEAYAGAAKAMIEACAGSHLVVLLPRQDFSDNPETPQARPDRYAQYNQLWRSLAETPWLTLVESPAEPAQGRPFELSGGALRVFAEEISRHLPRSAVSAGLLSPDPQHLELVHQVVDIGSLTAELLVLPAISARPAECWEVEVRYRTLETVTGKAIALVDLEPGLAARQGRAGVTPYGKTQTRFYRYLDTSARSTTRFIVEAPRPHVPTQLALEARGDAVGSVVVEQVRVWQHR